MHVYIRLFKAFKNKDKYIQKIGQAEYEKEGGVREVRIPQYRNTAHGSVRISQYRIKI